MTRAISMALISMIPLAALPACGGGGGGSAGSASAKHLWDQVFGDGGRNTAEAVQVDGDDRILVGMGSNGSVTFGQEQLTTPTGTDGFVAKSDAAGTNLWSVQFGGSGDEKVNAIATGGEGNHYVGGRFTEQLTAASEEVTASDEDPADAFLSRVDADGNVMWLQRFGDAGAEKVTLASTDPEGNVVITGHYTDGLDLGGGALAASEAYYFAKFDSSGSHLWSKAVAVRDLDAVQVDNSGNIVLAGVFKGSADAAGTQLSADTADQVSGFVAKYEADGTPMWNRVFESAAGTEALGLATDEDGSIYVTGEVSGSATFGGEEIAPELRDAFVLKLNASGEQQWVRHIGSEDSTAVVGMNVSTTPSGNVVCSGTFFGDVRLGGRLLETGGETDLYLAKFTGAGEHVWSFHVGGTADVTEPQLATDSQGNAILSGEYQSGEANFGGDTVSADLASKVFVAKYEP
jgi:hypothetical protein